MFDSLNAEQQAAVDHTGSPLLIVAGAGTGKTKTLAARVCRIIEDGADPSRILLLTFTRRAAAEMLARVAAVSTDRAASRVWGGTFHSTANRLLRNFGQSAGLSPGFTVLDQADATDLMGIVRTDEGFGERGKRFPRKETVAGIYSRMVSSQAKLADVLETDYPWCADHSDDLKTIFTAYTARKRTHQVLDYDDLLLFWRGLTASTIGDAMRDLFDHVLIDEYQDTNPIQADIVRGMCRPDTDLCAVGDDAQAIYGFRAATVANMWEFADHFPGATRVTLEQNYRSTMPILAVANAVLGQSDEHFAKELWSSRPQGLTPILRTHHDESAQSGSVATAVLDARERGMDLREQAVLFRAGHHADGLELELTRRDIPYVKYGGLKYLESAHVKDLLALLRILDNPADQLAWHRVLATMEGVGPATVRRLSDELGIEREDDDALARFIDGAGRTPSAADEQALELRTAFAECSATEPAITPAQQVDRLKQYCALVFPNRYDDPAARVADIDQLASTAAAYTTRSRFLTELTLDPPSKTSDQAGPPHLDDDWLTLSTIHSAKGLEWRSVHLIHAADGNMPSEMALGDEHGLAEELRLMYVALTRAKDELTVNFPLRFHVNRYATDDRHVYAQLSRFVDPVRELFDEETDRREIDLREPDAALAGATVGVADEVDTLLASLWD
ncbi:MAG: DNA helicase [Acidimicrobiales bacterium]|nr:MAG: DNA helicase [Acidimicrobiales bacterium]